MCLTSYFFDFLLLYFLFLVTATQFRKFISYKGIFYLFTMYLLPFVIYQISLYWDIILCHSNSEFLLKINSISWLSLDLSLSLRLDALSYFFVLLVSVIGLGTNFYILNYFKYEANEDIFAILINWFMFSMLILVLANNLFTLFLGWESIGLSSFFLINFWNTRRGTVKSSFKAFFFNKISDVFLFIFLIFVNFSYNLNNLNLLNIKTSLTVLPSISLLNIAAITLFICTLFKSAQLVGHLWLPDSMEAPVPASALIHSATLVSAGIYLLLRFTPLIVLNNLTWVTLIVGSITAAYGGIVSASQTDMKKLLAYSTISHCGFLFVSLGTEIYLVSIIYLFLHGLFKALTFYCAGSFIRVAGSQDTRQMGGLSRVLPVDTIFLIICAFNLGGLPYSIGYLYKSTILSALFISYVSYFVIALCFVGMLTSMVYVFRLVYYSAFDLPKEYFPAIVYDMQQKTVNVVKYWSLTTYIQIVAISILFFFSLWIYVSFVGLFLNSNILLNHLPVNLHFDNNLNYYSNFFFKNLYETFYSLYILIFCVLSLVTWRAEYSFIYRLNFLTSLSSTTIFIVIYTTIL